MSGSATFTITASSVTHEKPQQSRRQRPARCRAIHSGGGPRAGGRDRSASRSAHSSMQPARPLLREVALSLVMAETPLAGATGRTVEGVSSNRADVREFLVTPPRQDHPAAGRAGLYGGNRRVPGLRREESRHARRRQRRLLQPGWKKATSSGVSDAVLDAIARASSSSTRPNGSTCTTWPGPQGTRPARAARRRTPQQVRPGIRLILDGMTDNPGLRPQRPPGHPRRQHPRPRPVLTRVRRPPRSPVNLARFRFFDPAARDFYPTSPAPPAPPSSSCAPKPAATPTTRDLTALIGELSTRSEEFRALWAAPRRPAAPQPA